MLIPNEIIETAINSALPKLKEKGNEEIESLLSNIGFFSEEHLKNIEEIISSIKDGKRFTDTGLSIIYKLYKLIDYLCKENEYEKLKDCEKEHKETLIRNLKKDLLIEVEKLLI